MNQQIIVFYEDMHREIMSLLQEVFHSQLFDVHCIPIAEGLDGIAQIIGSKHFVSEDQTGRVRLYLLRSSDQKVSLPEELLRANPWLKCLMLPESNRVDSSKDSYFHCAISLLQQLVSDLLEGCLSTNVQQPKGEVSNVQDPWVFTLSRIKGKGVLRIKLGDKLLDPGFSPLQSALYLSYLLAEQGYHYADVTELWMEWYFQLAQKGNREDLALWLQSKLRRGGLLVSTYEQVLAEQVSKIKAKLRAMPDLESVWPDLIIQGPRSEKKAIAMASQVQLEIHAGFKLKDPKGMKESVQNQLPEWLLQQFA